MLHTLSCAKNRNFNIALKQLQWHSRHWGKRILGTYYSALLSFTKTNRNLLQKRIGLWGWETGMISLFWYIAQHAMKTCTAIFFPQRNTMVETRSKDVSNFRVSLNHHESEQLLPVHGL